MKRFLLVLFLPAFAVAMEKIGDEAFPKELISMDGGIASTYSHKEIIQTFSLINKAYHQLCQEDWAWRNIDITPGPNMKAGYELELLSKRLQKSLDLPIRRLSIRDINLAGHRDILLKWITSSETLVSLSLVNCHLEPSQGRAIGKWLKSNKSLKYLDVSCNNLGYSGSASISEALMTNETLIYLDLSKTLLGDTMDTEILDEIMEKNHTLKYFYFKHNEVCYDIESYIRAVKRNKSLRVYNLEGTTRDWSRHAQAIIDAILAKNATS